MPINEDIAYMYELHRLQQIPATMTEIWDFISSPRNLSEITPDYMRFEITSENLPEKMYAGMLISYKLHPVLGIPLRWTTIITEVGEPDFFIDEQQKGPYKIWKHEHYMRAIPGGVEMKDRVHYQPPLGVLGKMANALFIRRQLEGIFDYRFKAIEKRFGKFNVR